MFSSKFNATTFIIFSIYLSLRYGGVKLQSLQNGRHIKILERVSLSKENSLVVTKLGDKAYVLGSTNGKIEILKELSNEELLKVQEKSSLAAENNIKGIFAKLLKIKKEDKNE